MYMFVFKNQLFVF